MTNITRHNLDRYNIIKNVDGSSNIVGLRDKTLIAT